MITATNLTKRYRNSPAVDDVSFSAEPGRITGFLGPNGAGKSTTMRMLVGLAKPTSGSSSVLGVPFRSLDNPGRHVGVLLDAGAQHPGRTGRESLALSAQLMGMPAGRADDVLEIVGLTAKEGAGRLRGYSLGMRQRLGLANALLGDPAVLILDEPSNGLDPAGIRWMRGVLTSFAASGGTVLLSSHLLLEVEAVADDLVIIGRGRVLAKGSAAELLAAKGTSVRSLDDNALSRALTVAGFDVTRVADGLSTSASVDDVGRIALGAAIVVTDLHPASNAGLEELFFAMTAQHGRGDVPA
ncbi:ABC transporter [Cryobacterium roopkundense]|uniref:ABC transporter n=1 Tax=Cryobacterium roopkundense TaxID=1001240 RepID=A0A099JER7_9MICO|nr:ATP-binding cassette domain-containing protein [Cryobacterium roopkundense]KGJ76974.1 ABC transporter [Cryobacterium roopkundense]MBB5640528.1 ABC-2 type transport system ATP-binding protein [Cryobacterium roopkundense]